MSVDDEYRPDPQLLVLGDGYFDVVEPARFPKHVLRHRNDVWAPQVGLSALDDEVWLAHFAGFEPLPDNLPEPLAMRYHGHQFRQYNPALGDGRGFTFAQLRARDGRLLDLGTKGSGTTPYSRGGDGRLTLKGGVREVLATTMLEALGVDTSKSFSLVETGEALQRNDEPSPTRSAVLVRLSHGHIRIGTFQRLAAFGDDERINELVAHCLEWYLPEASDAEGDERSRFFDAVVGRVATTAAGWMAAGFVHGVLNTDNINITGESFDYGPWRFLPHYDPMFTAAYFDHSGLYAYGRQAEAVQWNLMRLAEALTLAGAKGLDPILGTFEARFGGAFVTKVIERLGLAPRSGAEDGALVESLFGFLRRSKHPFDAVFFDLYGGVLRGGPNDNEYLGPAFAEVRALLEPYEAAYPERLEDPYYQRSAPITLTIDVVEAIWEAIDTADDWGPFEAHLAQVAAFARLNDNSPKTSSPGPAK